MPSANAMTRIKERINPDIPAAFRPQGPTTLRAKLRIDEEGSVTVQSLDGGTSAINSAVRRSLEKWKFVPAIIDDHVRCVETELPILMNR
jgi:hypothetical protein